MDQGKHNEVSYIAPLMADFRADRGNRSYAEVLISSDGKKEHIFIVRWQNLELEDQTELGQYTFQLLIEQDGRIVLYYDRIPQPIVYILQVIY